MANYTPGPWSVGRKTGTLVFAGDDGGNGDFICEVSGEDTPRAVNEANARLIAAAPDLMSIVYGLIGVADRMDYDPDSEFGELVAKADAAFWRVNPGG